MANVEVSKLGTIIKDGRDEWGRVAHTKAWRVRAFREERIEYGATAEQVRMIVAKIREAGGRGTLPRILQEIHVRRAREFDGKQERK